MGCVYFTRHGQTVWNVENKICGSTDIELTELGHKQGIEVGKFIANSGIKIDEILYSPLIRAAETARHISEETKIPCKMEIRLKSKILENMNQLHVIVKNLEKQRKTLFMILKVEKQCFIYAKEYIIF